METIRREKIQKRQQRLRPPEEDPILHTPGAEMPDPDDTHHVSKKELEALSPQAGAEEEETSTLLNTALSRTKSYWPFLLGTVGLGIGILFLVRRFGQSRFHEEGDTLNEGQTADEIEPSRLLGA